MSSSGRPWPFGPQVSTETKRVSVRLRCTRGHVFKTKLATCINLRTDRELLDDLALTGINSIACAKCKIECQVALPVFLFDPENERAALYVPNQISYMELYLRAVLMNEIVGVEAEIPPYVGDLGTLVGSAALVEWKEERKKLKPKAKKVAPKEGAPDSTDEAPLNPPARITGFMSPKPSIRDAFADLDDEGRPTTVPPGVDHETEAEADMDMDMDEADDDWLDDGALNLSKPKPKGSIAKDGGE